MSDETLVQKQVRLVLEQQCRQIAALLQPQVPAGVGFILFLSDFGDGGNTAYVSTVERASAIKLVQEWLDHNDDTYDVKTLRALLVTAGEAVSEIAKAVGFEGVQEDGIARLVAHCRSLKEERDVALKEEQRAAFNVQKAAARIAELEEELSNEHAEWLEGREEIADLEAANDWPLARKQLTAHRSEIRRLRSVIRTGGAAYRLERAAMGIPGGVDADGQPIAKASRPMKLIHDDDCDATLEPDGLCPRCGFHPDMQSTAFVPVDWLPNVARKPEGSEP